MSVKAFQLCPFLLRSAVLPKFKQRTTSLEFSGNNLYIGTEDGVLLHFRVEEITSPGGQTAFKFDKQGHKQLSSKKAVAQIISASALNRLLVLTENILFLHQMMDLEAVPSSGRVKSVTSMAVNERSAAHDPYAIEICTAVKKNFVRVYLLSEDKFIVLKEVSVSEPMLHVKIDGSYICAARQNGYDLINYESGTIQELFTVEREMITPLVEHLSKGEFLLSAPGNLCMFASTTGNSLRPPLQWGSNVFSAVYSHPYILAINDEFLTVHNVLDQQQKQAISFQGGMHLGEYEGRILLLTDFDIYYVKHIPHEEQIEALMRDKRITEALQLAENVGKTHLNKEQFSKMYKRIQQQAGFVEFAHMNFQEAGRLFTAGNVDPKEIIAIYGDVLIGIPSIVRAVPPLHDIPDMNHLTLGDKMKENKYMKFLQSYLEKIRLTDSGKKCQLEVDSALLRLYALQRSNILPQFLDSKPCININESIDCLQTNYQFYALGKLYDTQNNSSKALEIWTEIVDGRINDPLFPGLQFIIEYVQDVQNDQVYWTYADWLLRHDQIKCVSIFLPKVNQTSAFSPEKILDYLANYPEAQEAFLEEIVKLSHIRKEKFHTHLVKLYLDKIVDESSGQINTSQAAQVIRKKLQALLKASDLYNPKIAQNRIMSTTLYPELVILHNKLGEHHLALEIIVYKMRDFSLAEMYCLEQAEAVTEELLQYLLELYLKPLHEQKVDLFYVAPVITLLNNHKRYFCSTTVFEMIPPQWSVGLLGPFLAGVMRNVLHKRYLSRIGSKLSEQAKVTAAIERRNKCCRQSICMDEEKKCFFCGEVFYDTKCALLPNKSIVHLDCLSKVNEQSKQIT